MEEEKFSWSILEHRMLMQAISMTASDLSASTKPWDVQVQTVKVIFEEFYLQGDAERAAGRQPIPMMDRTQPDQQAMSQVRMTVTACIQFEILIWFFLSGNHSQVGFLTGICIPCYTLLYRLIPETKTLLDMCQANLARWQSIADEMQAKREQKNGTN